MLLTAIPDIDDPHKHENKFVALIIVGVIFGFAIWKAWPAIMANNVFSKDSPYDYGRSEELLDKKRSAGLGLLAAIILLGGAGVALLLFDHLFPDNGYNDGLGQFNHARNLFLMSLVAAIANFIYTLLDETVFADVRNLKFSLKVWLSTILVSPLFLLLMDHKRIISAGWFFTLFVGTTILAHGIAIATLALLIYSVHRISETLLSQPKKRLYILLVTEAGLLLNMLIVALLMRSGSGWLLQVLPYCVVMGICIWFYPMDKTVYSKPEFYDSEIIP